MPDSRVGPGRSGLVARSALCAALLSLVLSAPAAATILPERPRTQAACAAWDVHLLGLVEENGAFEGGEATLGAAMDAIMRARAACRAGQIDEALAIYERVDLGRYRYGSLR